MPEPHLRLEIASGSDVGRVRENNEDRLLVAPRVLPGHGDLLCVADGMGGHVAGEEAADEVVEALGRFAQAVESLGADPAARAQTRVVEDLMVEAHEAILEIGRQTPEKAGMGTTGVAALVVEDRLQVLHSGDSRAYLLRGVTLDQVTQDHVVIRFGNRFLSAHVGMPFGLILDRRERHLIPGDRLLLCSDGLTDMVQPELFGQLLHDAQSPQAAVDSLIKAALEAGGVDNVSCVVAFVYEAAEVQGE